MNKIKVIDLFAGLGGLSEGFSSFKNSDGESFFKIALSIEKDKFAYQTLKLRSFYRQFDSAPDEYYEFIKGKINWNELKNKFPREFQFAEDVFYRGGLDIFKQTNLTRGIDRISPNSLEL